MNDLELSGSGELIGHAEHLRVGAFATFKAFNPKEMFNRQTFLSMTAMAAASSFLAEGFIEDTTNVNTDVAVYAFIGSVTAFGLGYMYGKAGSRLQRLRDR